MKLSTLKKQAQASTAHRGHRMVWARPNGDHTRQHAVCSVCGLIVHLTTNPEPNDIHISGGALALGCKVQS